MNKEEILWRQKAHSNSNNYKNFGYLLYELIGGKLTLLAFISLFSFAGFYIGYFGQFLSIAIGIFLYSFISDAFNIFWTGVKLEYVVSSKAISFVWGGSTRKQLAIAFEEITNIFVEYDLDKKRSAIIFENVDGFKNGDFGFSQERYFKELSFENVADIQALINILNKVYPPQVQIINSERGVAWEDKLPSSNSYLKFLQLLALTFLYLSSFFILKIVDCNFTTQEPIVDTVINQQFVNKGTWGITNHLTTKNNYSIVLTSDEKIQKNYLNEEVSFSISPMFNQVSKFNSFKAIKYESLVNGYNGMAAACKILTIISMLFSCFYIFYMRGIVPFHDLSAFILTPAILLILSFFFFT